MFRFGFSILAPIILLFNHGIMSTEVDLYNFNTNTDPTIWVEQSDTLRTNVGLSKAALVLHQNGDAYRRAVFFTLLNLQPNGAGFAGMRVLQDHDLSGFNKFVIQARAQGSYRGYKLVLRHKGLNSASDYTFEQFFTAPSDFAVVNLPFADFKPYFRGREITNETIAIDFSYISAIGLQAYGGVYEDVTQSGPGTLEVDFIKASS